MWEAVGCQELGWVKGHQHDRAKDTPLVLARSVIKHRGELTALLRPQGLTPILIAPEFSFNNLHMWARGCKITRKYEETLQLYYYRDKMEWWLQDKYDWSPAMLNTIDWQALHTETGGANSQLRAIWAKMMLEL